jgi:hypothetical protein
VDFSVTVATRHREVIATLVLVANGYYN